jgi:DNA-binding XRE family transcriptional regulator
MVRWFKRRSDVDRQIPDLKSVFTRKRIVSSQKVQVSRQTLKAARVQLEMDQAQLAQAAGLSRNTIIEFENGKTAPHESTKHAIQAALEARGIVFTNGDRPGFYFDKAKVIIPTT